jgi:hypothetical protein
VLEVAGGVEDGSDNALGKFVEDEQIGLELADFVFDFLFVELALPADGFEEGALGPVDPGGVVAFFAGPDVLADDPAVDPSGAGVIASAIGAGFPGHEVTGDLEAEQMWEALHTGGRARDMRAEARRPGESIGDK